MITRRRIPGTPRSLPSWVKWGEATTDEMCIGFLGLTKTGQDLTKPGEKDDFMDILRKQEEELRAKYEKQLNERKKSGGRKDAPAAEKS